MTQTAVQNKTGNSVHQQVTDLIIAQLENGTVPWERPWESNAAGNFGLPKNGSTAKHYNGINILLLWSSISKNQFQSHEWATFKQWQALNQSVRKGEKGSMIVFFDKMEREEDGEMKKIPFLKKSYVFNKAQLVDYVPIIKDSQPKTSSVEMIQAVETFLRNTKAVVNHHAGDAYYQIGTDQIYMPNRETFIDTASCTATEGYYATMMHELTHWTGHSSRKNRHIKNRFGSPDYAAEELTAELGAAFLNAGFGIGTPTKQHHANYIANWLTVLKQDNRCVITAASHASKAVDFLHGLQPSH